MKKIITALLAMAFAAGSVLAQEIEITGEIKTGLLYENRNLEGNVYESARLRNNDGDSGLNEGRIRFGINSQFDNIGLRTRFSQIKFSQATGIHDPSVERISMDFAFAYVDLLDRQITVSAGLLGESPWGTGGPELFKDLEEGLMGIRTEWKPGFLPVLNGLNIGFALLQLNGQVPWFAPQEFGGILKESMVGIAYEHDYFAFRFAYHFYMEQDVSAAATLGAQMTYRVEERILGKLLPEMSISANGFFTGIGAVKGPQAAKPATNFQHWLYILYDPDFCTAGINIGYLDDFDDFENHLDIKPYFYWKFFNNLLNAGLAGGMQIGFDMGKNFDDSLWNFWFLEPQVKVNISSNFYTALVYRYTVGANDIHSYKNQQTNWFNLRLCYTF